MASSPLRQIGSRRQLLVDDYVVGESAGLTRTFHAARKHPANPVLAAQHPWEFPFSNSISCPKVLCDPAGKQYRIWYETFLFGKREHVCHATSADGLCWDRPMLDLVEFEGSRRNNIVSITVPEVAGVLNFPQLPRAMVHCPEMAGIEPEDRLYKALQWAHDSTLHAYFSADGLRWKAFAANPVARNVGDRASACKFSDEYPMLDYDRAQFGDNPPKYLAFPKVGVKLAGRERRAVGFIACHVPISYSANAERSFAEWTPPALVLAPDHLDDEMGVERIERAKREGAIRFDHPQDRSTDFYGMSVLSYDGLYFGLLEVFDHSFEMRRLGAWNHHGVFEMQAAASRDLLHWQRLADRRPLIARGGPGEWDRCMILMASPVVTEREIRIYYQGTSLAHADRLGFDRRWTDRQAAQIAAGERPPFSAIGLATLRLDGFASLDACPGPGTMLTQPLAFHGTELVINAQAPAGSVEVQILRPDGAPVPGFGRHECDPFRGDETDHVVTWRGAGHLAALDGGPVRLSFHLRDARLYAFRFRDGQ